MIEVPMFSIWESCPAVHVLYLLNCIWFLSVCICPIQLKEVVTIYVGSLIFSFPCLLLSYTASPGFFTKLQKPMLLHLWRLGMVVLFYLDDCLYWTVLVFFFFSICIIPFIFCCLEFGTSLMQSVLQPTQFCVNGFVFIFMDMIVQILSARQERVVVWGLSFGTCKRYSKGFCCLLAPWWQLSLLFFFILKN